MLSLPPILCFHSLWIGKEESNNYAALQCKIINWPHSKWRPSGFYGFENMGVVLDSVYSLASQTTFFLLYLGREKKYTRPFFPGHKYKRKKSGLARETRETMNQTIHYTHTIPQSIFYI